MTDLVLPDLDADLSAGLRRRAERHGRSVEAEAQAILRAALRDESEFGLGTRIAALFAENGLEEGELPTRPFTQIKPLDFESKEFDP